MGGGENLWSELAVRPEAHRLGVNTFYTAFRRLTYFRGKLVAEKENRPLESVGKGKGWQRKESTKMGGYCLCELLLCGSRKVKDCKVCNLCKVV